MSVVLCDAREYDAFTPLDVHRYGASEPLALRIAHLLRDAGHKVDGIWKGTEEIVHEGIRWYPWTYFPRTCDVLVSCEWLVHADQFEFKRLIVPLNKINPILNGFEDRVNAFVVFSQEHKRQLLLLNPTIRPEQVVIISPGVTLQAETGPKVHNRVIYCNTPDRGLVHLARAWPKVVEAVPDATLVITYGVERAWEQNKWHMDNMAEELLEIRRWLRTSPQGVIDVGRVSPEAMLRHQREAELYAYPADAALPGIVHALAVMEAAAAGCGILLSRLEGLPEVFADCADFLDIPIVESEWAAAIVDILRDEGRKKAMGERAYEWAKQYPWSRYAEAWCELVAREKAECKQPATP